MDRNSLRKLVAGKSLASQRGFVRTFNAMVDAWKGLSEGIGVRFNWEGMRLTVDATGGGLVSGGGSSQPPAPAEPVPPWENPWAFFRVERESAGVLWCRNCHIFINHKYFHFPDFKMDRIGAYVVEIGYSENGNVIGGIESCVAKLSEMVPSGWKALELKNGLEYPLFDVTENQGGMLEVATDYVHNLPNYEVVHFERHFRWSDDRYSNNGRFDLPVAVKSVRWNQTAGALEQDRGTFHFWARPYNESVTERENFLPVVDAEVYEV